MYKFLNYSFQNKFLLILIFGIVIRLLFAAINSFFIVLPGADNDAIGFHHHALHFLHNIEIYEPYPSNPFNPTLFYSYVLSFFLLLTNEHIFFGSILSIIFWILSYVIILRKLKYSQNNNYILIFALLSFLPSSIIFSSITTRESAQFFVLVLLCSFIYDIFLSEKITSTNLIKIFFVSFIFVYLHLIFIIVIIILLTSAYVLFVLRNFDFLKFSIILFFTIFSFFFLIFYLDYILDFIYGKIFPQLYFLLEFENFFVLLNDMIRGSLYYEARTSYKEEVIINNYSDLIIFWIKSIVLYFSEPLPFRFNYNLVFADIIPISENIIRLLLIAYCIKHFFNLKMKHKYLFLIFFLNFLILESLWALVTTNWGSSFRHHYQSLPFLIFCIIPYNNLIKNKGK